MQYVTGGPREQRHHRGTHPSNLSIHWRSPRARHQPRHPSQSHHISWRLPRARHPPRHPSQSHHISWRSPRGRHPLRHPSQLPFNTTGGQHPDMLRPGAETDHPIHGQAAEPDDRRIIKKFISKPINHCFKTFIIEK